MLRLSVSSPTRADLAGGTVDIWPLYCLFESARTINVAIDLVATTTFEVEKSSAFHLEISNGRSNFKMHHPLQPDLYSSVPSDLRFPVVLLSQYLRQKTSLPLQNMRVVVATQAPQGSGLGGSSSLAVALIRGLAEVLGELKAPHWEWDLLHWVKDAEACFLKLPTGTQDYLASLFGGLNSFSSQIGKIQRETYSDATFEELSERLLIFFTGDVHNSGMNNWELFRLAMEGKKETLSGLKEIRDLAEALHLKLSEARRDWKGIGECLNKDWEIRRDLFRVQTPRQEEMVTFLKSQSVLGCKVCGAAHGGGLLVLVSPDRKEALLKLSKEKNLQILPARCLKTPVLISY